MDVDVIEVLAANDAFYEAFRSGDVHALCDMLDSEDHAACVHPGWAPLHGQDDVRASWAAVMQEPPDVRIAGATAHVLGDVAFVVCFESIDGSKLAATNIFRRRDGRWRIVHHHAGVVVQHFHKVVDDAYDEVADDAYVN